MFKVIKKTHENNIPNIFKVNNKVTRAMSGASFLNFEHMSHLILLLLLQNSNKQMLVEPEKL